MKILADTTLNKDYEREEWLQVKNLTNWDLFFSKMHKSYRNHTILYLFYFQMQHLSIVMGRFRCR